ncbi:MAG: hypothetical protein WCU80_10605, partial [Paludibacteraceae bacterium]
MVNNIPVPNRLAVIGSADNPMNPFLTYQYIADIGVEFTEGPFFIPFSKFAILLALTIYGSIIT